MSRIYTIRKTLFIDNYLFEVVECDRQFGMRCRTHLTNDQLMGEQLYKYADTKYGFLFKRCLINRFGDVTGFHKFEAIVWCSPIDTFADRIGIQKSRKAVEKLIARKKTQIKKFFRTLEKNNLPEGYAVQ